MDVSGGLEPPPHPRGTTVTVTTRGLPPITVTERQRNLRTGRLEVWQARTPGWMFVRTEEPGTPWYAQATDTRLVATFTSLLAARRAAAYDLRKVLHFNARRAAIRSGTLASHRTAARYRCACGGLLTDTPDRHGYAHIDGCIECVTADHRFEAAAVDDEPACDLEHLLCDNPTPLPCIRCNGPARIDPDCHHDNCCGTCCCDE
jgi:hypothetical protein